MKTSANIYVTLPVLLLIPILAFTQVTYSPNPLDFGSHGFGDEAISKYVWMNNNTDDVLTVLKAKVISSDENIYSDGWSGTIEPHSRDFIEIWWRPSIRGTNSGFLIISHSFSEQPDTVNINAMTNIDLAFWSGVFKPEFFDILPTDISTGILTLEVNPLGGLISVNRIENQTTVFAVSETSFVFGGAKSIGIDFKPSGEGTYYDTLTIYSDATNSPTLYPIVGNCIPSYISYNTDILVFPDIVADEIPSTGEVLPLTISYVSDGTKIIKGRLHGNSAYRFENGTSDSTIQLNINSLSDNVCNIIFDPRIQGDHTEPLIFTYDGYGSPDTVMLHGLGIQSYLSTNVDTLYFPDLYTSTGTFQRINVNYSGASSIHPGEPIEIVCKIRGTQSYTVNSDSVYRYKIINTEEEILIGFNPYELGSSEADLIIYSGYEQISPDTVRLIKTGFEMLTTATGIVDNQDELPNQFRLYQNYPNPFNPGTMIKYALPRSGAVRIEIYNPIGQIIWSSYNDYVDAGYHDIEFNAQHLPSGVYFCRIEAGEFQDVKKMVLLR